MTTHQSATPRDLSLPMAKVLNETVAELGDRLVCRQTLAFAGYTDIEISEHLDAAIRIARDIRAAEIERRSSTQWK